MNPIFSPQAPAAIGPYSQAIVDEGKLYTSGQIPLDPQTGNLVEGGIASQTRQALDNLGAVLKEAGTDFSRVIKTLVFITNMDDFAVINEIYAEYFTELKPARSVVQVAALPKNSMIEIEAVATVD